MLVLSLPHILEGTTFPYRAIKIDLSTVTITSRNKITTTIQVGINPPFGNNEKTYASLEDVIFAFEDKRLSLHEWVWVRFNGEVEDEDEMSNPQKTEELEDGSRIELWNLRRDRFDSQNNLISRFVLTTVGRVVMNYTIIDSVSVT